MTTSAKSNKTAVKHSSKIPARKISTAKGGAGGSSSIFDRLHSASTTSSRTRKQTAPVVTKNILTRDENEEKFVPNRTRSRRNNVNVVKSSKLKKPTTRATNGAVFNRLYSQGTASSSSKRKNLSNENLPAGTGRAALKPKNHA